MTAPFLGGTICRCAPLKTKKTQHINMNFWGFEEPQRQMAALKNRATNCHCGSGIFLILQKKRRFFFCVRRVLIKKYG